MKIFVVLSAVLAVALCRPDVSLGYNYPVPHTSYGVPTYNQGIVGSASNVQPSLHSASSASSGVTFQIQKSIPVHQSSYVSSSDNFNSNIKSASEYATGYTGYSSSAPQVSSYNYNTFDNSGANSQHLSTGLTLGSSDYQSSSSYVQHQPELFQSTGSNFQTVQQQQTVPHYVHLEQKAPAQVFKHFYVHTAPEEPEVPRTRAIPIVAPPQKHYKVIFVKAPNQQPARQTVVHYPPQVEEKTLVYVLSKKSDDQQDIIIPKVEQKAPAKPEVFYIKYDKEGGEHVINKIVSNLKGNDVQTSVVNSQEEISGNSLSSSGGSYSVGQSDSTYQTVSKPAQSYETSYQTASKPVQSYETTYQTASQTSYPTKQVSSYETSNTAAEESQSHAQLQVPHQTYGVPFRA